MNYSLYNKIVEYINTKHPDLVEEVSSDMMTDEQQKKLTVGNFGVLAPEDRAKYGNYRIWIWIDNPKAKNEVYLTSTLCHEFGHYTFRTKVYPRLFGLGRYAEYKLSHRKAPYYMKNYDFMTKLVVIAEEFGAWVVGWWLLKKFKGLTLQHVKCGLKCFSTYLR